MAAGDISAASCSARSAWTGDRRGGGAPIVGLTARAVPALGGPSGSVESLLAKIEAVLVAKGSAADEEEWEVVPAAAGEVAPADVPADVPAAAGAE